ncbi:hypothetical protein AAFC00_003900 [Neodothiora populina]|uniref:Peptidase A1 domain-containing protein n=1 Tax=Neodothiora populina TaxID=2781224 RepID=A0ABR3PFR1_9PEZI
MRRSIQTCLALAGAAAATSGTLEFALSKRDAFGQQSQVARGVLLKRQDTIGTVEQSVYDVLPWSLGGAYYTNISVGTPPQVQTVILDTGSSDTYLDASSAAPCQTTGVYSCRGGSFDSSTSSTYRVTIPDGFETAFGDGSSASGDFATDVVQLGDVQISNVQFGLATKVNSTTGFAVGLMGIGYSLNEASQVQYANMPEVLRDAGVINSRLYSVFLNDIGDASGTILFGGIDTSKYSGNLVTLNLLPVPIPTNSGTLDVVYEFVVAVTALSATNNGETTEFFSGGEVDGTSGSLPVLLDTGSAAWTVPTSVYDAVARLIPDLDRYGFLPCSSIPESLSLKLTFGGAVDIEVPASELIVPVYDSLTNEQNTTTNGEPLCTFMLSPGKATTDQPFLTLGDAVLRSMYVVFDLDNGQVSIAQARTNTSTSASSSSSGNNIKVVQAGLDGVANAVGPSSVSTAPANGNTIAPAVSATAHFSVKTTLPAIGTATGTDAVPGSGRVGETAAAGGSSGSASGSSAAASSSGAASGLRAPPMEYAMLSSVAFAVIGIFAGAALML